MTTNYRRGADFERLVRADMEARGYVAIRSPASKTPCDVYCMRPGETVFVQCKTDGRLPPAEWNGFLDYCAAAGAVPLMASKGRRGEGIRYHRLTGRKEKRGRQPMEEWNGGRSEVQRA